MFKIFFETILSYLGPIFAILILALLFFSIFFGSQRSKQVENQKIADNKRKESAKEGENIRIRKKTAEKKKKEAQEKEKNFEKVREEEYKRLAEERAEYEQRAKGKNANRKNKKTSNAQNELEIRKNASILGLSGKVNKNDIKKAYRELISQYHPDKVQHLGPELQQLATVKTRELTAAYEFLKKEYHIV